MQGGVALSQGEQHAATWLEVAVTTSAEAVDAISEMLMQLGAGGVVIDDPRLLARRAAEIGPELIDEPDIVAAKRLYIKDALNGGKPDDRHNDAPVVVRAYLPGSLGDYDWQALQEQVRGIHAVGLDPGPALVTTVVVSEEDWADAWKRFYTIQRIGRSIVIVPSWLEYDPMPGDVVVQLDPGMAFGTGTHPSTRLCLAALEDFVKPGCSVLDIGTGSGILAITAAKLGAMVTAIDIDAGAVAIAAENAAANQVEEKIVTATGTLSCIPPEQKYDLIVANIVADAIIDMSPAVVRHLYPASRFVAAGIVNNRLTEVDAAWQRAGLTVRDSRRLDEWVCLVGSL
jgi:ribosomal protein L11 methyltransferase